MPNGGGGQHFCDHPPLWQQVKGLTESEERLGRENEKLRHQAEQLQSENQRLKVLLGEKALGNRDARTAKGR